MTIREPLLGFSFERGHARLAYEAPPAAASDGEWDRRLQIGVAANELARVATLGEGLPKTDFDYAGVPTENVAEINKLASRIKATRKRHLEAIFEIGADLVRAKELLGHGNFLPWLQAEFRWSERTANIYMKIAQRFQGKTAILADLDIGTAYAVASAPPEVRNDIFQRAKTVEGISREEIKEKIAKRSTRAGRITVSLATKLRCMAPEYQSIVISSERPAKAFKVVDAYLDLLIPDRPALPEDSAETLKGDIAALRKAAEGWARKRLALAAPAAAADDQPALAQPAIPMEPIDAAPDELHLASIDRRTKMILKDLLRISSEASTDGWSNVADELTDPAHARENEQYLADIRETVDEIRQLLDKIAGGDKFQKAPDLRVA
jgi:hypothetical protein